MATLIKAYVSTDWKCRPDHQVSIEATGKVPALRKVMDMLVRNWQLNDLRSDWENDNGKMPKKRKKLFEALKKDAKRLAKVWTGKCDYRWEMEFSKDHDGNQRVLCLDDGDGNSESTSWTIVP